MKLLINKILRLFGIEIKKYKKTGKIPDFYNDYNQSLGYDYEKQANEAIHIVRKNTMLPYVNLVTLYEQVVYCEKSMIQGDFVECGVWKGGAIGLMALSNLQNSSKKRNLHLFDAFTDICAPSAEHDGEKALKEAKNYIKQNDSSETIKPMDGFYEQFGGHGTVEVTKDLLENTINYPSENINYYKGWFQDTLPIQSKNINEIAILRIDGDWYESTKICLETFYHKVVKGGIVIIDDYGCYEGCKKAVDEFMINNNRKEYLHYSNTECRYIVKN